MDLLEKIPFSSINEYNDINIARYLKIPRKDKVDIPFNFNTIFLKYFDIKEIYLLFWSGGARYHVDDFRWQRNIHYKVLEILKNKVKDYKMPDFQDKILDYINPYDEITFEKIANHFDIGELRIENLIKKMLSDNKIKGRLLSDRIVLREPTSKIADTVYITIPPRTKLTALKCPSCQAPLDYMPPCKCEHCGVMIELMK